MRFSLQTPVAALACFLAAAVVAQAGDVDADDADLDPAVGRPGGLRHEAVDLSVLPALELSAADAESQARFGGHGSALAQAYNHMILPLATRRDKETQVRWGIRDFERRFGRMPEGLWLPETAVDTESLEVLAEQGMGGMGTFDHRLEWLASVEVVRLPGRHHLHMEDAGPVARAMTPCQAMRRTTS